MRHDAQAWLVLVGSWVLTAVFVAAASRAQSPTEDRLNLTSIAASRGQDDGQASENTIRFRITRRPGQQEPDPPAPGEAGTSFALDRGAAEWTLSINDGAEVLIFHHGVQVVKGSHGFWAQGETSAGAHLGVTARTGKQVRISGAVDGLNLAVQGTAQPASPRELRIDLALAAAKAFTGITGGGMIWSFKLDSPTLGGKAEEPKLLLDKTGWHWPVGGGQELMVRFDKPLPKLFFDHDKKNDIRTFYVGDRFRSGRGRIGLTVILPEGGQICATDAERYSRPEASWYRDALRWDTSPVDLSFLNADDRPAGRHGFVKADGDRLVFEDGTPARFWVPTWPAPCSSERPGKTFPARRGG